MSSLKLALVAAIILAVSAPAGAGGRVDWSDFIDPNATPSQPRGSADPAPAPEAPVRAKKAKVSKAKKKVAKKGKTRKARSKKGRR